MTTDAVVLKQGEQVVLGQTEQTLVQLAPMPPGRSYVIWANGEISASNSHVTLKLEAFDDARDSVEISFNAAQGRGSFCLVVATTLPPDPDGELFTVAKLIGTSRPFIGGPETGLAVVRRAKLVILAVDSVRIQ